MDNAIKGKKLQTAEVNPVYDVEFLSKSPIKNKNNNN